MSILIPLPWTSPPISQNDRQHHHVKAKAVAAALVEARLAIRAAQIAPIVGAEITLHYRVPDKRRRDADNLAVTLKAAQDALVAEGVIPRDDWVHVPRSGCEIHPPSAEGPAMWLELSDVMEFEERPCP
jgi:Holliday junction resolvase RusA-like endonuclease